jgi:tetratricopeptide (TPR) repeat protein
MGVRDPGQRARRLLRVAAGQHKAKDAGGVEKSMKSATAAAEEIADPLGRASAFTRVAAMRAWLDDRLEARRALREAVKAVGGIENLEARAVQLCAIAEVEGKRLKDPERADDILKQAVLLSEQVEDARGKANVLTNAAKTYAEIDMPDPARKLMEQALSQAQSLEDPSRRADALAETAGAMLAGKQNEQAVAALADATEAAGEIEKPYGRVFALVHIAEVFVQAGRTDKAQQLAGEADALVEQIKDAALRQQAREQAGALKAKLPKR